MVLAQVYLTALLALDLRSSIELYRRQQFSAAEQGLRKVLAKTPSDSPARLYLVRTLIQLDRIPEALEALQELLALPINAETQFQVGHILRELADARHAELEAAAPDSAATRELAALRHEWAGNLEEALKQYRAAAQLDNKRPGIHYRIGNILWRKRDLDSAAHELQQELELTPYHGMANLRMGQVLLTLNQSEKAILFIKQAVAAMPDLHEARRELGRAYRKMGRMPDARAEWEAVAAANPEDDQIHYLLGILYRELGEVSLANRELRLHRAILEKRGERAKQR